MEVTVKRRAIFLFAALLTAGMPLYAQRVTFEVNAPTVVAVGEVFRVEFTANNDPKKFTQPQVTGLDLIAGPVRSISRSTNIVNGALTQDNRFSYIYTFVAMNEGEATIGEASVEIGRDTYKTKPVKIRVMQENTAPQSSPDNSIQSGQAGQQSNTVAADDVVMRVEVDKPNVYKGQPVKVTYKLYYRHNVGMLEGTKVPAFNGFWMQQMSTRNRGVTREELNGKIYETQVIAEYMLFPQQAGALTIEPFETTAVIQLIVQQRRRSPLDDFFGGIPDIQEIRRRVASEPLTLNVRELPAGAPASFNGAVGDYRMEADQFPADITANSAVTYSVNISGTGNMPQVQAPKITLPGSFEQYPSKATENPSSADGNSGSKQFEYTFIARVVGEYDIAPVEFTYFNPSRGEYVTLRSNPAVVRVEPDNSVRSNTGGMISAPTKGDVKILGRDIRFIKLGGANLRPSGAAFFGGPAYLLILAALAGIFIFLLVWMKKYLAERRNSALLKGRRANKVALLRFRAAEGYMKEENRTGFYEEMLKALWGYMSDKLNIPVANLTKENIREELIKKGVGQDVAERYIGVISECEYAQYAPAVSGRMNELYMDGVELISNLESVLGK